MRIEIGPQHIEAGRIREQNPIELALEEATGLPTWHVFRNGIQLPIAEPFRYDIPEAAADFTVRWLNEETVEPFSFDLPAALVAAIERNHALNVRDGLQGTYPHTYVKRRLAANAARGNK